MPPTLTEPDPSSPDPVPRTGAWLLGAGQLDRGAEYGAPSMSGVLSFRPQHAAGWGGHAGQDVPQADLGSIIGPRAAIGIRLP